LIRSAIKNERQKNAIKKPGVVIQQFSHLFMYLLVPLGLQTMLEEMAQITHKANWILLMRFTAPTNSQTTDNRYKYYNFPVVLM
jgi:hypothetical protein